MAHGAVTNHYTTTPHTRQTIESLWRLEKIILDTLNFQDAVQKICDSVLSELGYLQLGYRIVVLALVDREKQELKRIAISQTEEATRALQVTPVPFHEINIPLSEEKNFCIRALKENRPFITHDWIDILVPPYVPEEARRVQQVVGIKTSMVYPVAYRGKAEGILIFSMVKDESEVTPAERDLIQSFTDVVGLAVQNAKLYTSLQKKKEELAEANQRLRQLDKLKDEFVSLASHELRSPMTAIKSYVWMVVNGKAGPLESKAKDYLNIVASSTERLIRLVNDMLNISRIESGRITFQLEEFDLVAAAREVHEEFRARAQERGVAFEIRAGDRIPRITADKGKILEVIENLVSNALKFTPSGGRVGIEIRPVEHDHVSLSVSDTGRGISKDDLPKLFTKFGRIESSLASMSETGTGLGLYLSKQYAQLHGGDIVVESVPGKGSTFRLTIPVRARVAPSVRVASTDALQHIAAGVHLAVSDKG